MTYPWRRYVRHPLFPDLAATPAKRARGRLIAVAGTFTELIEAAARGVQPRRAVFALTGADEFLSGPERDRLWYLYQVPVYALRLNGAGRAVAWECEAQHGLHSDAHGPSDCPCGRPGVRLLPAETWAGAAH